jgi:hypothetical protein
MSDGNLVTPEDVGRRVTFQYELPNGYRSEVVGVLESFDRGAQTFLVRTKSDSLVRVPLRGVKHGKIVVAPNPPAGRA